MADRPGFGESASAVGLGRLQLESGATWTKVEGGAAGVFDGPEVLLRLGLGHALEFRATAPDWVHAEGVTGWADAAVGLKGHVTAGSNDFALRGTLYLPTGSSGQSAGQAEPEAALAWSRSLSSRWSLAATLSARRLRAAHETLTSPSISLGRALGERVATFVEYGANLAHDLHALHKLDHGYTWLVNRHTQLDASMGVGLSSSAPDFFVEVGYCRRF